MTWNSRHLSWEVIYYVCVLCSQDRAAHSLRIPDVGVVIVRDILHCEDLPVLLRLLILWPEGRIGLKRRRVSVPAPQQAGLDWHCWPRVRGCRGRPQLSSRDRRRETRGHCRCSPRATPSRCTPWGECSPAGKNSHLQCHCGSDTHIYKHSVDVVRAVVSLEWCDVRPEVVS